MGKGRDRKKKRKKQMAKGEQKVLRAPRPIITLVDEQANIPRHVLEESVDYFGEAATNKVRTIATQLSAHYCKERS